jgi:predicted nucleic-acid-binding protein
VIVADTNVWARAFLNDDAAQAKRARRALAEARSKDGVFLPLIVLAELSWVLRSRWTAERVLATLESLLRTHGVAVETPELVRQAVSAARTSGIGFADHLIAQVGFANAATQVITFDEKFAKTPKVKLLK